MVESDKKRWRSARLDKFQKAKMAEEAQRKVQHAVSEMMNDLDRNHLRTAQGKMHRCAATCCDDQMSSMESVQRCMEQCQTGLMKAQQVLEAEMNDFQARLMRCAQTCQDKVKTQVGPNTKESELPKFHAQLDSCILKCADDHIAQLPKLQSNLLASLKRL